MKLVMKCSICTFDEVDLGIYTWDLGISSKFINCLTCDRLRLEDCSFYENSKFNCFEVLNEEGGCEFVLCNSTHLNRIGVNDV